MSARFRARGPQTAWWNQAQGWQSARRAMAQRFLEDGEAARQSFAAAWAAQIEGAVNLNFRIALDRIDAAAKAKALAANAAISAKASSRTGAKINVTA